MMDRRTFVHRMVAGWVAAPPLGALAQPAGKLPRIGWLALNNADVSPHQTAAFRQGLRERGWIEGRNIVIESRYADGYAERLPALAAELLRLEVDIIVAAGSAPTRAAKDATRTIPIVMATSANALAEGFVGNLAQPGGNVTGMTFLAGPEIPGKQLELLKELAPAASRVAVLTNPTNASHAAYARELADVATSLKSQLRFVEARSPQQLDAAFDSIAREHAAALLVLTDGMFFGQRRRIAELAARSRLPAMYSQREFVDAGALAAYGPTLGDMARRAASHVDKILKGARPGELPVEQPTKFELVINLKTARALGITIPQAVLLRADEVIQ